MIVKQLYVVNYTYFTLIFLHIQVDIYDNFVIKAIGMPWDCFLFPNLKLTWNCSIRFLEQFQVHNAGIYKQSHAILWLKYENYSLL